MLKHVDPRPYPFSAYDDEGCLKPPMMLWVALLYLARGLVLPPIMGMGHWSGVNSDALGLLRELWQPLQLIPALMVLPVLCAAFRRVPQAWDSLRWIWRQGRPIMILAALSDVAVGIVSLIQRGNLDDGLVVPVFSALLDGYVVLYLLLASRVGDTFRDFPSRVTAEEARQP